MASYGKVGRRNLCLGRDGDIASPKHMRRAGHFIKTCVVHDKKMRRKVVLEGAADLLHLARAGEGRRKGEDGKGLYRAWGHRERCPEGTAAAASHGETSE